MERVRNQAKEMFPTIHLTLISIIQALALEVLWSAVNEREHLDPVRLIPIVRRERHSTEIGESSPEVRGLQRDLHRCQRWLGQDHGESRRRAALD